MTEKRTHEWTTSRTCPTCGNVNQLHISCVFNGKFERYEERRRGHKVGCSCEICGCIWHELQDFVHDEWLVTEIIREGDLYSEDE